LRYSTQESAMKFVFIMAIMFLGITAAQGQQGRTVSQPNGPASSNGTTAASDSLSVPTSSLSSASSVSSVSSPSPASQSGASARSATTSGSARGATAATGSASGNSQTPLLLPGEIPDTSTQAASTTAAAPGAASPVCPPQVPATDGGSANLSEIAGASLGGC
jgi:hypothetical protein